MTTPSEPSERVGGVRPVTQRPTLRQVVIRSTVTVVVNGVALLVLAWLVPGFTIDRARDAFFAGAVIGALNAVVWPALAFFVVPLSVLTLGLGSIVVNALVVGTVLDRMPGVRLPAFGDRLLVAVGLAVVTALLTSLLALDDDAWFDERMARRARRRRRGRDGDVTVTDVPGVVFIQLDGVAEQVLRRALASGDAPTVHRWIRTGSHVLLPWETDWSCQTGVSQCGILHGDVQDMPAFRWLEKDTGRLVVSNRPASAAEIERRHSDGNGLLAHHGSSYGNLFSGDAERRVMTMSSVARTKEGRVGAGYGRYFSRPEQAARTLGATVAEVVRERRARRDQIRRDVEPRIERGWVYACLRAFTTVVSRDVCVAGVLNDVAEGRSAVYCDLLGFDEVAHHSGPERADTLAVLRDLDRRVARIERSFRWAPRPYHLVVLSDHGQTQGLPFAERHGESLADVVGRLTGASAQSIDHDAEEGRTESTAWLRGARGADGDGDETAADPGRPVVLASGNLGLVYLPGPKRRLTMEEIDGAHPQLLAGLVAHPGVGFVLVRSAELGAVVLGARGRHLLDRGVVEGEDPLAPFGPDAERKVRQTDGFRTVADVMVNSAYHPDTDEVEAFEHQVSSHGGLGGPQTHPFLLHPVDLPMPDLPILGSPALHRVLKGYLVAVGQPVSVRSAPATTGA